MEFPILVGPDRQSIYGIRLRSGIHHHGYSRMDYDLLEGNPMPSALTLQSHSIIDRSLWQLTLLQPSDYRRRPSGFGNRHVTLSGIRCHRMGRR